MRSSNVTQLLQSDINAREYFDSLSTELKDGLLAHGDGINNLEELKHFADIMKVRGGRPY